jgi:hypothetical protein
MRYTKPELHSLNSQNSARGLCINGSAATGGAPDSSCITGPTPVGSACADGAADAGWADCTAGGMYSLVSYCQVGNGAFFL